MVERFWGRARAWVPLALTVLALVGLWHAYPHDFEISDPSNYALNADALLHGRLAERVGSVFNQRIGVYLPVAAVYAFFGVTPATTDLVPLLATLAIAFVIGCEAEGRARWFALACVVTCKPLVEGMMMLFPDPLVAAGGLLSTFALSRRLDSEAPRALLLRAGAGVFAWYCAMLAKETACWILPLWAGALLVDLVRRRRALLRWFHAPALAFGAIFGGLYLWYCAHTYGDALARVHIVQGLTGKHAWTIHDAARLKARLTDLPLWFFWHQYGVLPLLALGGMFTLPPKRRIWAAYTVIVLAGYWFGSSSLSSYQPLPLMPRMTLSCAPGFCLCAGFALAWISERVLRSLDPMHGFFITTLAASVFLVPPITDYVGAWHTPPDLAAIALARREVRAHQDRHYLLLVAERRSEVYARMSFGLAPPENVVIAYAGDAHRAALANVSMVLLFVDSRNQRSDRTRDFTRPFRGLHAEALFNESGVALFTTDDTSKVSALLTP